MGHIAHMNGVWRCVIQPNHLCTMTHSCVCRDWFVCLTHSYVWYDRCTRVSWPIHVWDVTDSYIWNNSSYVWFDWIIRVTWLIHVWHDSVIRVSLLLFMRDMTHPYVWRIHIFDMTHHMCVTWLIHMCDMTHSCVWHDSVIRAPCFIHTCDLTHSDLWRDSLYVWRDWFAWGICLIRISDTFMSLDAFCANHHLYDDLSHVCVCDMTHSYKWPNYVSRSILINTCQLSLSHVRGSSHAYL